MNPENSKIWGLIPAAGIGKRMASSLPKQYLEIQGKTVLEHSLSKLLSCELLSGVAIGLSDSDDNWSNLTVDHSRFLGCYTGGSERMHTVKNGLDYLAQFTQQNDWVLVHDAVRPCVELEDVKRLIDRGLKSDFGAILACAMVDTVKKISTCDEIEQTLSRHNLALAMTPQLFPIKLLTQALNHAIEEGIEITDEASAVEQLGYKPKIVFGNRSNLKITSPEDLNLANFIMQHQTESN